MLLSRFAQRLLVYWVSGCTSHKKIPVGKDFTTHKKIPVGKAGSDNSVAFQNFARHSLEIHAHQCFSHLTGKLFVFLSCIFTDFCSFLHSNPWQTGKHKHYFTNKQNYYPFKDLLVRSRNCAFQEIVLRHKPNCYSISLRSMSNMHQHGSKTTGLVIGVAGCWDTWVSMQPSQTTNWNLRGSS